MSEDQFTKLFKYVGDFRKEVNEKFEKVATKESVDRLTNTIDSFITRMDRYDSEQAARDNQFEKLLVSARKVS